jgi:hypothetical protein
MICLKDAKKGFIGPTPFWWIITFFVMDMLQFLKVFSADVQTDPRLGFMVIFIWPVIFPENGPVASTNWVFHPRELIVMIVKKTILRLMNNYHKWNLPFHEL